MARMIPSVIPEDCESRGEFDLFLRLRDDPGTRDWIVFHSLDIARHRVRVSGELDFVVLVPGKGVLCLEVKACRHLRRDDHGWYYGYDPDPDPRGPFKQAAQGMHSLRDFVRQFRSDLASGLIYWSAVIFPFIDFGLTSPEWHPWQVIDARAYRAHPISRLLEGILDDARLYLQARPEISWFHPASRAPNAAQCEELTGVLRSQFEFYENPRSRRAHLTEELKRYTTEQIVALRAMEKNPRVAFQGPAGTGKTLLAIESARRSRTAGRRILLLCFNNYLGSWLRQEVAALAPEVESRTLHAQMLHVAGSTATGQTRNTEFWQSILPDIALEHLLDDNGEHLYDELIVDEGQDVLRPPYLDFLDESLRGGLAAGRWQLFGDWENQAIYANDPVSGEDAADGARDDLSLEDFCQRRGGQAPVYDLRINCRNTPRIASWAETLGEMDPGYDRILREDDHVEPEVHSYETPEQELELLQSTLEQLERENYSGRDIVILSARGSDTCAAARLPHPWKGRIRPFQPAGSDGSISYSTIHAFKGLEAPAIIATDIDTGIANRVSLLFIATTRALNRLIVIPHRAVHEEVVQRILGGPVDGAVHELYRSSQIGK